MDIVKGGAIHALNYMWEKVARVVMEMKMKLSYCIKDYGTKLIKLMCRVHKGFIGSMTLMSIWDEDKEDKRVRTLNRINQCVKLRLMIVLLISHTVLIL